MKRIGWMMTWLLMLSVGIFSENRVKLNPIPKKSRIVLDGKINESCWLRLGSVSDFFTIKPGIGNIPSEGTEFYIAYSKDYLYLAAKCFDSVPGRIKTSMANRDNINQDDWISFELDMLNDKQINHFFRVNPNGIQADGTLNRYEEEDLSPDYVWKSRGTVHSKGYFIEIEIPFKSLRFGSTDSIGMSIGVRRQISRRSELISFPKYNPEAGSILMQRQSIAFRNIVSSRPFEINPLWVYGSRENKMDEVWKSGSKYSELGLNFKYGITSDLILDLTVNPDFSHVESDAGQVDINLRHSLYYREKRAFFLEGRENMTFGAQDSGMYIPLREIVNTRNIVDPKLGVKINGKIGSKNVLSSLFAIDEYTPDPSGENSNFSIFRYKRLLREEDFVGFIYTGKSNQLFSNHLLGVDGRFRLSGKSVLEYHAFASLSSDEETAADRNEKGLALGLTYEYKSRNLIIKTGVHDYGLDFDTQVGYLNRKGVTMLPLMVYYVIYPKSDFFQRIAFLYNSQHYFDKPSGLYEYWNSIGFELYLPRKTMIWFGAQPFGTEVYREKRYSIAGLGFGFSSQVFKRLYLSFHYFDKNRIYYDEKTPFQGEGINWSLGLLCQLNDQLKCGIDVTFADFYQKYTDRKMYEMSIYRSKTTYQLNKYLFIRAILEYNSYYRKLNGDFLASFTYIPGSVIQLGYGSVWRRETEENRRSNLLDQLEKRERSFFFKISYRFRF